ncbi:MAG: hypothetical protein KI786_05455, partial [Mameliella sp.]|nr:hypothetical protein [Phaeodactylibacter sp.]
TTGQLVFEGNVQSLLIGGVSGLNIDNVCINPSEPCGLTDMFVVAGICNPNGVFDVTVGIEYDGEPTDTLKLFTNGNYQYYLAGDFPLTLSPFVSPTNEMVFEVATGTNPDCSVAAILPAQDCNPDCALEGLVLDGDPICFPGEDFYTVILNPIGAVEGDTLIIYGQQSNVVQTVIYNGQQLLLDLPLNNEQFEVLEVCAFSGSADCCVEVSYDIGCGACFFVEMAIEPLPCDGDSLFYFELDFDILIDLPGNSFKVETSNGFLETFNYDDLPVIVGPVLGFGEPLTVWVNDLDGLCSASQTFISPDCADGCVLGGVNLLVPAAGCNDDGTYNIPMTLENAQNGDTLIVTSTVTGYSEVLIYGFPFNFNLQLSNWPAPSSGTDSLTICFYNQPNCCTDISFPVPCDPPPCDLQAQVEVINCQPNGVITLAVTTNSDIPDDGPFIMIKIGDFNYGLVGVNTTVQVGPIINPGTDELNVIVEQRSGFSNTSVICEISVPVDVSDCNPDCDIPGFEVYPEGCTGLFGSYFAYVDLDEAALDGEPINIYVNGDLYFSNYVGGDITLTLEVWALDPGDIQDVISICYADNPECCISKGVDALPCYCTDIYEVVAEASPCQGSEYYISLDLIAADFGDYFNLDVDGGYYGSYSFSDLPLQIGPFTGNGEPVDLFAYTDGFCQPGGTTVNAPLCDDGCTVEYAELIGIECDNDLYYAIFQLNAPASPDDTVLVFSQVTNNIGTALVDPFANEILSVTMPLPFEQYDALTICLGDQLDCCFEIDFDVPCGNQGCNLQGILADPTDCNDDGTYNLVFGVNYDGPPTSFVVSIPGINFNEVYALNELPVTIPNLPGDGDTYQINVEATDCNAFMEALFVAPACDIGCVFNSVIAEPHPCEDGFFMVDIEVQVNDPGDLGYFIFADGEIFGPFDYSEPFITLGPFAGDGVTVYDFLILDFANPPCFGYVEVGPKSCDNQNDCQILELSAVPLDCNDNGTYDLELNIEVEEPQNELLF